MLERLAEYSLSLHLEKTRLIESGRFAADQRDRCGLGKPETFNFLGFTFICGRSRRGRFALKRKSRGEDATANASANPRTGEMAEASRNRLPSITRGADQQSCTAHIPASRHRSLAPLAPTSEPEGLRGALSNERPLYVADCLANRQIC